MVRDGGAVTGGGHGDGQVHPGVILLTCKRGGWIRKINVMGFDG